MTLRTATVNTEECDSIPAGVGSGAGMRGGGGGMSEPPPPPPGLTRTTSSPFQRWSTDPVQGGSAKSATLSEKGKTRVINSKTFCEKTRYLLFWRTFWSWVHFFPFQAHLGHLMGVVEEGVSRGYPTTQNVWLG